jgi:hypothetical protein
LTGILLFSCLPRPSTVEIAALNYLGLGPVGLRRGEHHHKKREQQGDEIGIGHQPAFVVFVGSGWFP